MADNHDHDRKHDKPEFPASVAVFGSQAEARAAIAALHKAHYTHTWLGATSLAETDRGEETVRVETGGFFSGTESLVDALVKHGVHGDAARAIETGIEPGDAVVTVDPKNKDPQEALALLEGHGGRIGNASFANASGLSGARASTALLPREADAAWEEETFYRRF